MNFLPFASFRLWQESQPLSENRFFHCEMRRGFSRFRKKEPFVKKILDRNTTVQSIGLLAQRVVWEFHQDPFLFDKSHAIEYISARIELEKQTKEIQERIYQVIKNYQSNPILNGKNNVVIQRGDEDFPAPIKIEYSGYCLNLFAAIDCHFQESDNSIHILDFKTGSGVPDQRQAYVYLLAAQYLFPNQKAKASFYNLETQEWTKPVTASQEYLECVLIELAKLAQEWQRESTQYRQSPEMFTKLFPPNPGIRCKNCIFQTICEYSGIT